MLKRFIKYRWYMDHGSALCIIHKFCIKAESPLVWWKKLKKCKLMLNNDLTHPSPAAVVLRTATCWFCTRQKWELKSFHPAQEKCNRVIRNFTDQWCFLNSPQRSCNRTTQKLSAATRIMGKCIFTDIAANRPGRYSHTFLLSEAAGQRARQNTECDRLNQEHLENIQIPSKVSNTSNPQASLKNNFTMPKWISL